VVLLVAKTVLLVTNVHRNQLQVPAPRVTTRLEEMKNALCVQLGLIAQIQGTVLSLSLLASGLLLVQPIHEMFPQAITSLTQGLHLPTAAHQVFHGVPPLTNVRSAPLDISAQMHKLVMRSISVLVDSMPQCQD
jgi:hypothetical protein